MVSPGDCGAKFRRCRGSRHWVGRGLIFGITSQPCRPPSSPGLALANYAAGLPGAFVAGGRSGRPPTSAPCRRLSAPQLAVWGHCPSPRAPFSLLARRASSAADFFTVASVAVTCGLTALILDFATGGSQVYSGACLPRRRMVLGLAAVPAVVLLVAGGCAHCLGRDEAVD